MLNESLLYKLYSEKSLQLKDKRQIKDKRQDKKDKIKDKIEIKNYSKNINTIAILLKDGEPRRNKIIRSGLNRKARKTQKKK